MAVSKAKKPVKPTKKQRKLSHVDDDGRVTMVDVGAKPETARTAVARGLLRCSVATRDALSSSTTSKKGEALVTAKVAAILAAKQTGALIPLCHPVALSDVAVDVVAVAAGFSIEARVSCVGRTGVEMEALVAVSVCGLTLYDMGKAMEREMVLTDVRLVEKRGGKSGVWRRAER
ncbi:MAG: cyclic pyranopterin monophosphate synthase MoaC [Deltaproteobacteria bacterium]|nr:cyclic pyranopterin monophosphate synthase MoaC [Deltaproteobacteria bacterium]